VSMLRSPVRPGAVGEFAGGLSAHRRHWAWA
jgi:hypothetical protein